MHYLNKRLMNDYVKYAVGVIAYREEKRLKEELNFFLKFIKEQKIDLKKLKELKELDKDHLVEYFILLWEKKEDNDEAINNHIKAVQRFLNYLRGVGYIKKERENSNDGADRVKEEPVLYECA